MSTPRFAVVGHPNKGKSSIVATLAQDDSVIISRLPGTTMKCRSFPMLLDGEVLYELIDTPGFQRARKVLAWLIAHCESTAQRPAAVKAFIETYQNTDKFVDECELLAPMVEGAGILYVVDGTKPFGPEYEAEMEILRWTGQPSMALINLIGDGDHVEQWRSALGQYFRIVRVFNAMTAEFEKRVSLLRAFGEMRDDWLDKLSRAANMLDGDRQMRTQRSADEIGRLLINTLTFKKSVPLREQDNKKKLEQTLQARLQHELREAEAKTRRQVENIYDYKNLATKGNSFELLQADLFSKESQEMFGLSKHQLITAGLLGGGAAGSGFDLLTGGSSLLLGAGVGAIVGGASAILGYEKLAEIKVLGQSISSRKLQVGPIKNKNLPYVLLGRALLHHKLVASRTHANREALVMDESRVGASNISSEHRKHLENIFKQVRKNSITLDRTAIQTRLSNLLLNCITQTNTTN
ncbi:MAG: DUF3482 domain-containing protein [Arenicellales bacterium WSBS_2016_MAG_OTU3]